MSSRQWKKLSCPKNVLQLKATLTGGQSFRWKLSNANDDSYIGVMANCVWLLKQDDEHLHYQILGEYNECIDSQTHRIRFKIMPDKNWKKDSYYKSLLKAYFRLDTNLEVCYHQWSSSHSHFADKANKFYAIRVLDQDPVENLFSFICSQNNHISRISSLVEKLCVNYGPKICVYDNYAYHAFPQLESLADAKVEDDLRRNAFGYRAKFIQRAASQIIEKGGLNWFGTIETMNYKDAHAELIKLTGIGPKVADCICLMSLNHLEAIPVDTHVLKIAKEFYVPKLRETKSLTAKLYAEIGDAFRDIYGPLAGWAQTVLFCAELTKFKENTDKDGCSKPKKKRK